jgi:hypothetical protein
MVGMVRLEDPVMHQRMPLVRIAEGADGTMHDKPVEYPFEKRGKNNAQHETNAGPEKKRAHELQNFLH